MYTLQEPLLLLHSNIITKSTFLLELLLQVVSTDLHFETNFSTHLNMFYDTRYNENKTDQIVQLFVNSWL